MKTEQHISKVSERISIESLERQADTAIAQIEQDRAQAEAAARELEERELMAELEAAQRKEAETEAQEHKENIEKISGE